MSNNNIMVIIKDHIWDMSKAKKKDILLINCLKAIMLKRSKCILAILEKKMPDFRPWTRTTPLLIKVQHLEQILHLALEGGGCHRSH